MHETDKQTLSRIRELLASGEAGVNQWNRWRDQGIAPLSLDNIDLSNVSFSASFYRVNFNGISFRHATFRNADLARTELRKTNFAFADLTGAKFAGLYPASPDETNFEAARLESGDFGKVNLRKTMLSGAMLAHSNFRFATCTDCDFRNADLTEALFEFSSFVRCDLSGANLRGVTLGGSSFHDTHLPCAKELLKAVHIFPSTIDWQTLVYGAGQIPSTFLTNLGLPAWLAAGSSLLNPNLTKIEKEKIQRRIIDLGAGARRQTFPIILEGSNLDKVLKPTAMLRSLGYSLWSFSKEHYSLWPGHPVQKIGLIVNVDSISIQELADQLDELFQREPLANDPAWAIRGTLEGLESAFNSWIRDCEEASLLRRRLIEKRKPIAPASAAVVPHEPRLRAPTTEEVAIAAAYPECVSPDQEFVLRLAAYAPSLHKSIVKALNKIAPFSAVHEEALTCKWRSGTEITVVVSGRWIVVEDPNQTFSWEGTKQLLTFDVRVFRDAPDGLPIVVRCDFYVAGMNVGKLRFEPMVSRISKPRTTRLARALAASTAFASYAKEDKDRVMDRVSAVRSFAGIDIFVDRLSLLPGEPWKERLRTEIVHRDLFWLFWSQSAARSTWVDWEWRTALNAKSPEAIYVQPLESPELAQPPPELQHLHFGDVMMGL